MVSAAEGGEDEGLALALTLSRRLTQAHGLSHPRLPGGRVTASGERDAASLKTSRFHGF